MNTKLLCEVAGRLKSPYNLMNSRWQNAEAETIAFQVVRSCRFNLDEHGDAFTWQGRNTQAVHHGGLVDNPKGVRSLLADESIVIEPYTGDLQAPETTVRNESGQPMVIRPTDKLLEYIDQIVS